MMLTQWSLYWGGCVVFSDKWWHSTFPNIEPGRDKGLWSCLSISLTFLSLSSILLNYNIYENSLTQLENLLQNSDVHASKTGLSLEGDVFW